MAQIYALFGKNKLMFLGNQHYVLSLLFIFALILQK